MTRKNTFKQGNFVPFNPSKYVGTYPITYRSSWELKVMKVLDAHTYVLQWASEGIAIPYYNPVLGRPANYFPDFLIKIQDADGNIITRMIEIKPENQTLMEKAKSKKNKLEAIINQAKWAAAKRWCDERGFMFNVMTEHEIFHTGSKGKRS